MAAYTVLFSETPNNKVASDRFSQEIRGSAITVALDSVVALSDRAIVSFKISLSAPEEATLHALAAVHAGTPLRDVGNAKEDDGRLIVTQFPAMIGANTVFTGCGDDIVNSVRGAGETIRVFWDDVEARGIKTKNVQFLEPIELHDGEAYYRGLWTTEDTLSVSMVIPATTVTENVGNTGNARRIPASPYHDVFIPAAGDGDVDIVVARPVPTPDLDGFWDIIKTTGEVMPAATPGHSAWHLLSIPISGRFLSNIPLGAPTGVFALDVYRAEYIHQTWTLRVDVKKVSAGAGELAGWFLTYRKNLPE